MVTADASVNSTLPFATAADAGAAAFAPATLIEKSALSIVARSAIVSLNVITTFVGAAFSTTAEVNVGAVVSLFPTLFVTDCGVKLATLLPAASPMF